MEISLKIAFIAHHVNFEAGPATVTAHLVERLCEDHQVSVFSNTINGIDLLKVKHYKVPELRCAKSLAHITFLISSTLLLAALSLLRKTDFDIIHSTGYDSAFSSNVITSHFCERECRCLEEVNIIKIPCRSVWQKLKALDHRLYRSLLCFVERLIISRSSSKACIVVSQAMQKEFARHYGDVAKNIIVIPNGVDTLRFHPTNRLLYRGQIRQEHGVSPSDSLLMFAGGDWERKGVLHIMEALSLGQRPDVKLFICGSGDEKFYGQFAELKRVRDRIIFVPHSSNLWEYYAASDIFVLPTIYEPFGLVIVEAMASGLPVITSRVAGAAYLIIDGVNGLLLRAPSDVNGLAEKIELLLSNAELRETMGERARETAEKFSWDQVAQKTLEVYNTVLNRPDLERLRLSVPERLPRDFHGTRHLRKP
ncbi:MAG: glycosyltransferase family 1 protein [Dehalococcoidia bacterium]|nr:MAG: glycosyltransferase family 1 protein [Dehalococcoidia bacterium]